MEPGFREDVCAGGINLAVIRIKMVFEAIRLDETIKGEYVGRKEKS